MSSPPAAPGFLQKLGLFDATMLIIGTMIGSGIFIVSADIAQDVGSTGWLLAIWLATGLITIMGGLCYAELAAMMPHAGGQYVFLREAFSPLWGFLYGWSVILIIQAGSIAAVGVAFAKFLGVLVPSLGVTSDKALLFEHTFAQKVELFLPLPWLEKPLLVFERTSFTIHAGQVVALGVIAFLTLLNCVGVREGKWVQNIFTVAKTLALVALIGVGLFVAANADAIAANRANMWAGIESTERFSAVSKLVNGPLWLIALMVAAGAMVGSLFSADAWNNVTFTAGEIRNPRRNLPLSLILGPGVVIVLYLLANLAYVGALPVMGTKDGATAFDRGIAYARDGRVATAVLELATPTWGVALMAVAVMVSTFGCLNGMILMGARLYHAMAVDGLFFRSVGRLNSRGVPAVGLLLQGAWSILLVFSGTYNELLDYVIFAALLFYVLTVAGLFVLRVRQPNLERPVKAFGYPVVPALYITACAAIMLALLVVRPEYTWPGLILVLTGIPVYFLWRPKANRSTV